MPSRESDLLVLRASNFQKKLYFQDEAEINDVQKYGWGFIKMQSSKIKSYLPEHSIADVSGQLKCRFGFFPFSMDYTSKNRLVAYISY